MFHSYVSEKLVRQHQAELLAEAEKYRLVKEAQEARKLARSASGEQPEHRVWSRLGLGFRLVTAAVTAVLRLVLQAFLLLFGLGL